MPLLQFMQVDFSQQVKDAVDVPDSTGHTMKLYAQQDKPFLFSSPGFNRDVIENMSDFPLREDDILICSYSKSGCHWLWEIIRQMMSGQAELTPVEKETCMIELHQVVQDLHQLPSPRVLNNHQFFQEQPKDLLKKKIKVVFIYRNPKDVVVSYYHHIRRLNQFYQFTGDFSSFLVRFAEGFVDNNSFFEYHKSWEAGIRENPELKICILSYEDLQDDPMRHLQRLAQFLEKDFTEDFLTSVIKATSFDAMKTVKGDILSDTSGSIMYRKGKVGDWKDHFTVAQNIWFDHIIRTHMGRFGSLFPFRYSL